MWPIEVWLEMGLGCFLTLSSQWNVLHKCINLINTGMYIIAYYYDISYGPCLTPPAFFSSSMSRTRSIDFWA